MKKNLIAMATIALVALNSCSKDPVATTPTSTFVLKQTNLKGDITDGTVVLKSGLTYNLTGTLTVKTGATLKIEAGTTILAMTDSGASLLYISIERGGKIDAQGTAISPIIFTSTATAPGSWGGLCIHGSAPNNTGVNAASEINGTQYGGTSTNDNSGTLKYCIFKNSGAKNGTKEFNGISFFSVGSGTTVSYCAVLNGGDDAFEWYGGNVNGSYLYAKDNDDDNFDYDLGYVGTLSYLYSINTNANLSSDSRGIEADNHPTAFTSTPYSFPTLSNVTLVGRGSTVTAQKEGIYLRRGVKSTISNVYVEGYAVGVGIEHDETLTNITNNELKITTIQFTDVTSKTKGKKTDGTSATVTSVITEGNNTGAGNGAAKPTWASFVN